MSERVNIALTPEAVAVLEDVRMAPERIMPAVAKGMDQANLRAISYIQKEHLTGQGPFPVEEHKLGVRTGRLRGALWAAPTTVSGGQAESAIGDNVKYAAIHEFGGSIHHKARTGTARLRTDRAGNLLRQLNHPHLAIFARGSHKSVRNVDYTAAEHEVVMPERAPIRTGLQENLEEYVGIMSKAIVGASKGPIA